MQVACPVEGNGPPEGISIRLGPLVEVRAKFDASKLDPYARRPPLDAIDCRLADESGKPVADWRMRQAAFSIKLPPGRYTLTAAGTFSLVERIFTVAPEKTTARPAVAIVEVSRLCPVAARPPLERCWR